MGAVSPWHILIILVVVAIPIVVIGSIVYAVVASKKRKQAGPNAPLQQGSPPGWYPDPQNSSLFRWYDGVRWTDVTSPRA